MKEVYVVLAAVLSFAGLASDARAETVSLRAGDHSDFTRVVMDFKEVPAWTAGRTATGYAIAFESEGALVFDSSKVFQKIGRNRIASIQSPLGNQTVNIDLTCDCAAEIFDLKPSRLVIDIRPRPFGAWARHEAAWVGSLHSAAAFVVEDIEWVANVEDGLSADGGRFFDEGPYRLQPPPLILGTFAGTPNLTEKPEPMQAADVADSQPSADPNPRKADADLTVDKDPVIDAISSQFSRAISQGLVERTPDPPTINGSGGSAIPSNDQTQNFRSLTVFDRDAGLSESLSGTVFSGAHCISGQQVQVSLWGDPAKAGDLGALRLGAVAEDGSVTDVGRLKLARYYLALGFGSEARHLAEGLRDSLDRKIIKAIGDILDNGHSDSQVFDGQISCQGDAALWALLSKPATYAELPQSTDDILASFSALPRHLRTLLGPLLSERLRQAGEPENARTALNAVTRAGGGSRQQDLTAARLALMGTNAEGARDKLEKLTRGTDFTAAEALLELLLDAERRGVLPKASWVDDSPSLIRATQGTEVANKLSMAALRGHVPLMRFDALRRSLNTELPGLTPESRASIAMLALGRIADIEDESKFVRAEVGFSKMLPSEEISEAATSELVQRLHSLGLSSRALKYLPLKEDSLDARLLMAEVLFSTGSTEQSLDLLDSNAAPEFALIRAKILETRGNFRQAAEAYLGVDDQKRATLKALQSADWDWLSQAAPLDAGAHVGTLLAADQMPNSVGEPSVDYPQLVTKSEERRAAVQALLDTTTVRTDVGS